MRISRQFAALEQLIAADEDMSVDTGNSSSHGFVGSGNDSSFSVLLIEDDDADALLLKRLLKRAPNATFTITHESSLVSALKQIKQSDFDVAIVDINLPDARNAESFEQIRALDSRLPIVVLTGDDSEELAIYAIRCGAQDYLTKGEVSGPTLARALRFAIVRHRMVLGLQTAAGHDQLTGLPNRRHLDSQFALAQVSATEQQNLLPVCLLDLDYFKQVNDRYGHCMGDAVLKKVAQHLSQQISEEMWAGRFGGEEFILLMPGLEPAAANDMVERLLGTLEAMPIVLDGVSVSVTASAGLAMAGPADTWEDVYARCDSALYQAKQSGRNQVASIDFPVKHSAPAE